jgi:hypothetical protein
MREQSNVTYCMIRDISLVCSIMYVQYPATLFDLMFLTFCIVCGIRPASFLIFMIYVSIYIKEIVETIILYSSTYNVYDNDWMRTSSVWTRSL